MIVTGFSCEVSNFSYSGFVSSVGVCNRSVKDLRNVVDSDRDVTTDGEFLWVHAWFRWKEVSNNWFFDPDGNKRERIA